MAARTSDIEQVAGDVGLRMATYSPGDGVTRYRFFYAGPGPVAYFDADGVYTALGAKEAMIFLEGVAEGVEVQLRKQAARELARGPR